MGFEDRINPGLGLNSLIYEYDGSSTGNVRNLTPILNVGEYTHIHTQMYLSDFSATDGGTVTLIWEWRQRDREDIVSNSVAPYVAEYQDIWGRETSLRHDDIRKVVYPYLRLQAIWSNAAGGVEFFDRSLYVSIWGLKQGGRMPVHSQDGAGRKWGTLMYLDATLPVGTSTIRLAPYTGRAKLDILRLVSGTAIDVAGISVPRWDSGNVNSRWYGGEQKAAPFLYSPSEFSLGPQRNALTINMSVIGRVISSISEIPY